MGLTTHPKKIIYRFLRDKRAMPIMLWLFGVTVIWGSLDSITAFEIGNPIFCFEFENSQVGDQITEWLAGCINQAHGHAASQFYTQMLHVWLFAGVIIWVMLKYGNRDYGGGEKVRPPAAHI